VGAGGLTAAAAAGVGSTAAVPAVGAASLPGAGPGGALLNSGSTRGPNVAVAALVDDSEGAALGDGCTGLDAASTDGAAAAFFDGSARPPAGRASGAACRDDSPSLAAGPADSAAVAPGDGSAEPPEGLADGAAA
jgi:hypothetical protein